MSDCLSRIRLATVISYRQQQQQQLQNEIRLQSSGDETDLSSCELRSYLQPRSDDQMLNSSRSASNDSIDSQSECCKTSVGSQMTISQLDQKVCVPGFSVR